MSEELDSDKFKDLLASIGDVTVEWARLEVDLHGFMGALLFGDIEKGMELFIEINAETMLKMLARIYFSTVSIEEHDIVFSNLFNRIKVVKTKRNGVVHAYWNFYPDGTVDALTKGEPYKDGHKKHKKIFTIDLEEKNIEEIRELVKDLCQLRVELEFFRQELTEKKIIKMNSGAE